MYLGLWACPRMRSYDGTLSLATREQDHLTRHPLQASERRRQEPESLRSSRSAAAHCVELCEQFAVFYCRES